MAHSTFTGFYRNPLLYTGTPNQTEKNEFANKKLQSIERVEDAIKKPQLQKNAKIVDKKPHNGHYQHYQKMTIIQELAEATIVAKKI